MPEKLENSTEGKSKPKYMLFGTDLYGVAPNVPFNSGSIQNLNILEPLLRLFMPRKEVPRNEDGTSKPRK